MFVAGGYGAARKTPTGVGSLDAVAAAGMAAHGIASIFTIVGGARLRRDRYPGALENGAAGGRARAVRRKRVAQPNTRSVG